MPKGEPPMLPEREMVARHHAWASGQEMTVRCAVPGCNWMRTGPASEVLHASLQHRESMHPDLPTRTKRKQKANPARITRRKLDEEERAEIEHNRRIRAIEHGIPL